jgi:hypothetical protein
MDMDSEVQMDYAEMFQCIPQVFYENTLTTRILLRAQDTKSLAHFMITPVLTAISAFS